MNDFVNASPVYKAIYENFADVKMPVKLVFKIDRKVVEKSGGLAGYWKGSILFKDESYIKEAYLREEMIHALQACRFYGDNQMITCRKNIQFEAKVFQDLMVALRGNGGGFIGSVGHSKIYMAVIISGFMIFLKLMQ